MRALLHAASVSLVARLIALPPKNLGASDVADPLTDRDDAKTAPLDPLRAAELYIPQPRAFDLGNYARKSYCSRAVIPPNAYRRRKDTFARNPTPYR